MEKKGETWLRIPVADRGAIGSGGEVKEIEENIVERLVRMHSEWIGEEAEGK